jgi:hypothetical protein
VDFRVTATPSDHLEVMAGVGRLFPGAFVRSTRPAAAATWSFAQVAYSW